MNKSFLLFLVLIAPSSQSENLDAPNDYIDEGACPFECCIYREWSVKSDTQLFIEKDINSEIVVVVKSGSKIKALTGDVHVTPLKITVNIDYEIHRAGETIWLLNYLGEGNYRALKNDELIVLELPFSPYGKMKLLEWANLEGKYHMDWWVQFKTKNGKFGWTNQVKNFSNKDGCAGAQRM